MVTGTAEPTKAATGEAGAQPTPSTGLNGDRGGAKAPEERIYRQSEVDALLGKAGQRIQAKLDTVTTERDTLKSQLDSVTAEITEAKESIASLTKDIEAMSEDDPDKHAVVKLRRDKETELKALKKERTELDGPRKEIAQWKRDQLVYTVADEYASPTGDKIDMDSFKKAADRLKLSDRDELEALAEEKGYKRKDELAPAQEASPPPLKPLSTPSDGGTPEKSEEDRLKARYPSMYKN